MIHMLTDVETYLITRGDAIHSVLSLLMWLSVVITLIALITSAVYAKVFSEDTNASDEDLKGASSAIKVFFNFAAYVLIIIVIKAFTPKSEDLIIMAGLKDITTEQLYKTSTISGKLLEEKFPTLTKESNIRKQIIKKLEYKNDSLTILTQHKYINNSLPHIDSLMSRNSRLINENKILKNTIDSLNNL